MLDLEWNPEATVQVRIVGRERTPVVVVDDPLRCTRALIDYAATGAQFSTEGAQGYPGVRAPLPAQYAAAVLPQLEPLISRAFGLPAPLQSKLIHQLFSLVAQPAETLQMLQRAPHFDNRCPFYFATVHYLAAGAHGGTGIFRHRPTGFESVSEARYAQFVRAAEAHVRRHGPPPARYIRESDNHFELIEELPYRANRLLLYPGYLLHSGLIDPDRDISADPATGRLTANLFLLCGSPS